MIEPKAANAIRATSKVFCEDALRHAIGRLVLLGRKDDLEAAVWLQDIVEQRGCEHLDTGAENTGRLVDAIDIIIRG